LTTSSNNTILDTLPGGKECARIEEDACCSPRGQRIFLIGAMDLSYDSSSMGVDDEKKERLVIIIMMMINNLYIYPNIH
jgi:hypothetical protein